MANDTESRPQAIDKRWQKPSAVVFAYGLMKVVSVSDAALAVGVWPEDELLHNAANALMQLRRDREKLDGAA